MRVSTSCVERCGARTRRSDSAFEVDSPSPDRFHAPNETERAFLAIVTRSYPELAAQIDTCLVDDYDRAGYLDVCVSGGPTLYADGPLDGPSLPPAPISSRRCVDG